MTIIGGTFSGKIENQTSGRLNLNGGKIEISNNGSAISGGIVNLGVLNLYRAEVSVSGTITGWHGAVYNTDKSNTGKGILNLYGDLTSSGSDIDFYLEKAMNVCDSLQNENPYTVYVSDLDTSEENSKVFANVADGVDAASAAERFVSNLPGYVVLVDGKTLAVAKCPHESVDDTLHCETCGFSIYAQVGESYYATLQDAFDAVNASAANESYAFAGCDRMCNNQWRQPSVRLGWKEDYR